MASCDLVVLGGGPGGYVAAIRAAQLGLSVTLVEREHLGGICLNWGCIPTKTLLRSSGLYHDMRQAGDFGLSAGTVGFDLAAIVKRSRAVARQLNGGVGHLLKKNGVTVQMGRGRLTGQPGAWTVAVTGESGETTGLAARAVILATGARARTLPGLEPDGKLVWTYREAMVPPAMPASLLVVGSGAIGMEFASFYSDLGCKVTVAEAVDRILPAEDAEISAMAHKIFTRQGMTIHTGVTVTGLDKAADSVTATLGAAADRRGQADGRTGAPVQVTVDRVILAVGIVGNTEDLGLEAAGIAVERGHVVAGAGGATAAAGVYAIGDLTGPPWLAHKASHEGVLCAEHIAGGPAHALNTDRIPGCTYCRPQIASIGMTEARARESGRKLRIGRFPWIGNGKAIALGETTGMVKTIFDADTGEMLGAHMLGAEVTEMIQGHAIAMTLETTEAELMQTVFPHPTLGETMHESVLDAWDRAIHI